MLLLLAVILLVLWLGGWLIFPIAGAFIHVLLLVALVCLIWHFLVAPRSGTPLP